MQPVGYIGRFTAREANCPTCGGSLFAGVWQARWGLYGTYMEAPDRASPIRSLIIPLDDMSTLLAVPFEDVFASVADAEAEAARRNAAECGEVV